ncbi:rhodanese-like domain-containing protein [Maritimibacter fusiformis]|uniref:Rhodanese-like domain-containing protein n=1 Tax=Maritimibacter fusiformis TaxID=2603819 RepID=A0A5D0RKW9_9RHOB|nr:rhodanese-like domain-containing protein [Maritimibacter fusiformis]TYB82142.1 rhodanese-like domain-containing protein [Maritimibacter fusiformis]
MRVGRIAGLALGALTLAPALPLAAGPLATVSDLPDGARIVDIRAEATCGKAAPDGARCLPAEELFADDTASPVSFHALRWLLGTIGLGGDETVAIYPASDPRAEAVAALIYLAGQREVVLLAGAPEHTDRGESRSFSREVIFTAPMRTQAMRLDADAPPPLQQLTAFARASSDTVAFAPDT